jgi:hypothetical protein
MAGLSVPLDEVVHFDVVMHSPSTGGISDGDSAPTFDVFEEATDTPILDDQTMTKRTSLTGNYRGTFTASAANGFEVGKFYIVIATGTVGGVTGKVPALIFRLMPAEASAGVPKVDLSHIGGDAQSATDLKDFADAGYDPATNKVQGVVLVDTTTTLTNLPAITANWLTAAGLAADAVTEIQSGLSTLDAAGIRTAVGLASANLDTQLADLPTNAELATSQASADDATLAAIAGLNNLDAAAIRSAIGLGSANLDTQLAAIAADLPTKPTRAAQFGPLPFLMVDETDGKTPEPGVTVTATVSKDGGAFAACTNAVSEISGGFYKITLTGTEMTADFVALKFTATGCAQRSIIITTQPT